MLDRRSTAALEFPKIIERLVRHCQTPPGRSLAESVAPSTDLEAIRRGHAHTAEALALRRLKPNFQLGRLPEIDGHLLAASRHGLLAAAEVLEIGSALRTARAARNLLAPHGRELPLLSRIAGRIADFSPLIGQIEHILNDRGDVLSRASAELARSRQQGEQLRERLERALESILRRAVSDRIAQEALITERDGRYVIPIKAELRRQLPSVVHDVSASGATLFVEPLAVVELGNRLREARREEEREIERILRRLCDDIAADVGPIRAAIHCIAQIDLAQAKARLAQELDAPLPAERGDLAWLTGSPSELRLLSARHPLLTGTVVPISISLTPEHRCALITGPNTGGKTVALKTVGLLTLMAQAGLPIPAEPGSRLPVFENVFADIGDEQSIEQSLSTFSAHVTNIIRILADSGSQTLVLLDELGAGTDPGEGAALAQALLEHLLELESTIVATTHHGALKVFAHAASGIVNASAEFNAQTLQPTYRLLMGAPGRSNALAIAERLGMPAAVLARARTHTAPDSADVEGLLSDLQQQRDNLEAAQRAAQTARAEAEAIHADLAEQRDQIDAERDRILTKAEQVMEDELSQLRRALREANREITRAASRRRSSEHQDLAETRPEEGSASSEHLERAAARAAEGAERLERLRSRRRRSGRRRREAASAAPPDPVSLSAGDVVYLRGLPEPGVLLGGVDNDTLEVQLGSLRTRVRSEQIERLGRALQPEVEQPRARRPAPPPDPGGRCDIRGRTTDDALPTVDSFLDRAYRAGRQRLEIVHGKGTGALRRAVHGLLREHPLITSYETAPAKEGGDGVTIAHLVR